MSEPITKACPSYNCDDGRRVVYDGDMPIDKGPCASCGGSGRVPDVEGQLRAEVARLTEERDAARNDVASLDVLARVDARVSDYEGRAGVVGLLSPLVTYLLTGSETAAAMVMLAGFVSAGTALWVLNVISGERRKS